MVGELFGCSVGRSSLLVVDGELLMLLWPSSVDIVDLVN